ncbi:MAG: hypothetical protein L6Q31_08910 [Fimbriimonadaceae bacterium]|nr:hypothetical protein [Fimbriimonadaceae bacterium]NUM38091.1 hypothetical protein [Armatimonadota bacterium]HQU18665.1 hypothetical protein [Fimbriimonadaceae bacterium]
MSEEPETLPGESAPEPKQGMSLGKKVLVLLVTLGSIAAGINAGIQVYEYLKPKSDVPEGWTRVEAIGAVQIDLPPNWELKDKTALQAMTADTPFGVDFERMFKENFQTQFFGKVSSSSYDPTVIGLVAKAPASDSLTLESLEEAAQRHPGTLATEVIKLPAGRALRNVTSRYEDMSEYGPDAPPIEVVADQVFFVERGTIWMLVLYTERPDYMDFADTFLKIAKSLRFTGEPGKG